MIEFSTQEQAAAVPIIKIIGIGGAGGNTINNLVERCCDNIYCIAANTDSQALEQSKAQQKIQLGIKSTRGLGTGANPELGKHAAQEDLDKIIEALSNANIVFLTAGMGGGTGSGALPVVAHALKEEGILSIALVTTPFIFEGKRRTIIAREAIEQLKPEVDALIIIPNQRLLEVVEQDTSLLDAFALINDMLSQSIKGIADIVTKPGYINVDYADLKAIMKDMGLAVMGTGRATGSKRAAIAAQQAISSPLLENMTIKGAHGVLLNISGDPTMRLHEINEAASIIYQQAAEDAHIIIGAVIDKNLQDEFCVSVIATGFEKKQQESFQPPIIEPLNQSTIINTELQSSLSKESVAEQKIHESNKSQISDEDLCDLDVPTFMRQQKSEPDTSLK